MTTILGLSGSLRAKSFNAALLRAAAEASPDGVNLRIGAIASVPLLNQDEEAAHGPPEPVRELQRQLREADALLLATPEYNNGIPGVFKNALDWMSRGEGLKLFAGKPVALIGASPGGFGTVLSQAHWLPVLRALGTRPWFGGRLVVAHAAKVFDAEGHLIDDAVREQLASFMRGFAESLRTG